MDREILFRGKRLDNGEWAYWNQFGECTEPLLTDECMCSHISEEYVDPTTVGQYTGLTDKNGVKIFEGDVCQMYRTAVLVDVEIVYRNAACWGFDKEYERLYPLHNLGHDNFEIKVIGNIHEQEAQNETI